MAITVKFLFCALVAAWSVQIQGATESAFPMEAANTDVSNVPSLQRGAKYFVNYCLGCHSAQYVRYNRLGEDLGLTEDQLIENLMFTAERPHDTMINAMASDDAARWFGQAPPDLSLIARSRGSDYLFNFLRAFYVEEGTPTGVNNLVLENTSMPHVLWELQGIRTATFRTEEVSEGISIDVFDGFEIVVPGELDVAAYDQVVRDIVNFLDYISEQRQVERRELGVRVIAFLFIFLLFAFLLKKEIWRDVH